MHIGTTMLYRAWKVLTCGLTARSQPEATKGGALRRSRLPKAGIMAPKEVQWGPKLISVDIMAVRKRPLPSASEDKRREDIAAIATIGQLIRKEEIKAYTSAILQAESGGTRREVRLIFGEEFQPFYGCEFHDASIPVDFLPSYLFLSNPDKIREACIGILALAKNREAIETQCARWSAHGHDQFKIDSLRDVHRYTELCKGIDEGKYVDAFHVWTCERNGIDVFLTMDYMFINAFSKKRLSCRVLRPCELLKEIDIKEIHDLPLKEGKDYFWEEVIPTLKKKT